MKKLIFNLVEWVLLISVMTFIGLLLIRVFSPQTLYGDVYVKEQYRYNISAVEDNRDLAGRIYYRSGFINQELYYYLIKENDDYKEIARIPANKTRIIETNEEVPKVIYYAEYFSGTDRLVDRWTFGHDYYELYIPEQTVSTKWNIDLE